ncbi:MAG: GNAT family N-acetyltransferase [Candidatus Dormibacteraceae bacterium]
MLPVRRLTESEWEAYREVRLAALADTPGAFGSTYRQEMGRGVEDWRTRLRERACFVAFEGDRPAGIACGIPGEAPGSAELVSMWVDPQARRRKLGRELVRQVLDWAAAEGFAEVRLTVVDDRAPALALYRGLGFVPTGRTEPYPNDGARHEIELALPLRGRP